MLASALFTKASVLLHDEEFIRWKLPELGGWLNEGIKATLIGKPDASSKSIVMQLQEGTLQTIPSASDVGATDLDHYRLLNITRNLKSAIPTTRDGGRVVRQTSLDVLDTTEPRWHDSKYVRFQAEVRQWAFDERNPLEFYVYPGNDGTGIIEAVVSAIPADVAPAASADVTALSSWGIEIPLKEPYSVPLLDYLLFRCQSKDDSGANAGRAAMHYQQFATAVGLKVQSEQVMNPKARPKE